MPETTINSSQINQFLSEPLRVGEPVDAGPLTLAPVFGPEPRSAYVSFAQGRELGVRITELETGASVRDLVIENPSDERVLLFEGEEVLGAQQNRTFDNTVLVDAHSKTHVPVSCVEQGRWDGRRHGEEFRPAEQTASPRLRRLKAQMVRERAAAGAAARPDQGAVWDEVAAMSADHKVASPTGAIDDVYTSRRDNLRDIASRLPREEGQTGSIVFIDGQMWVADLLSRPDAYASLHERLVQGYALDALAQTGRKEVAPGVDEGTARGAALLIEESLIIHRTRGVALGEEIRFADAGISGSGLICEDELIQLSVYRDESGTGDAPTSPSAGRVRRPSQRRRI